MATSDTSLQDYRVADPDVQLMLRVRDDDASAFEELVLRYQNRLVSVMEQLVRRREQAEDLAQEVFLRVYRARKNYEPQAKFSTWLFTIANNVAKNAKRSLARRKEVNIANEPQSPEAPPALEQMALAASGLMPARQLDRSERAEMVRLAIQSLNERQRMALMLSKFENMSYVEIAETMEMSVQATKSLLCRAREKLRELLEPYMQDGASPGGDSE